jgi:hypothetical protein
MRTTVLVLSALLLAVLAVGAAGFLTPRTVRAAAACPAPNPVGNRIMNSGFDTSLTGWQMGANKGKWVQKDADACTTSGAVTFKASDADVVVSNCFAVNPGDKYAWSMRMIEPSTSVYRGSCEVFLYAQTDCQVPTTNGPHPTRYIMGSSDVPTAAPGAWLSIQKTITVPPDAHAANVLCGPAGSGGTGDFFFDQLYFTKM